MKIKFLAIVSFICFLSACAPEPEKFPESGARFDFGPSLQDAELDLSQLNEQTQASKNNWLKPNNLRAGEKLDFVENIFLVGARINSQSMRDSAITCLRQFREQHQVHSVNFEHSP